MHHVKAEEAGERQGLMGGDRSREERWRKERGQTKLA